MENRIFFPLYTANLNIDNLYGLVKTTIEISKPLKEVMSDLVKAALNKLEAANAELEKRMKKTLGSALTPELTEMNRKRNKLFAEIKRFVSTADKSSIETLKKEGSLFKIFLDPYWDTEGSPLNTITSIYEEILDRFNTTESLKKSAEVLGITVLISELENINIVYDELYKKRNNEISNKTGNSASKIKDSVVQVYEQYCISIEQSVNLVPNKKIEQLFNDMDGLRRKYAIIKPKPRKENEEKE